MVNLRSGFYNHPYATMVTGVFLFAVMITVLYFFGLIPGETKTQVGLARLSFVTGILLVATIASWIVVFSMRSVDG